MRAFIVAVAFVALCGAGTASSPECGGASWYSLPGQKTASGERMNPNAMTAAHKSLPMGSIVRVTNQKTGKIIEVTINDRGPYIKGRIIDLSKAAGRMLGIIPAGTGKVCIERIS